MRLKSDLGFHFIVISRAHSTKDTLRCRGGTGERETGGKGGWEVYGRRENRVREAGEKGEITQNCRIFRNLKNCKEAGANKYRAGIGIKEYGKREV